MNECPFKGNEKGLDLVKAYKWLSFDIVHPVVDCEFNYLCEILFQSSEKFGEPSMGAEEVGYDEKHDFENLVSLFL